MRRASVNDRPWRAASPGKIAARREDRSSLLLQPHLDLVPYKRRVTPAATAGRGVITLGRGCHPPRGASRARSRQTGHLSAVFAACPRRSDQHAICTTPDSWAPPARWHPTAWGVSVGGPIRVYRRAAGPTRATCNVLRATCNVLRATCNVQRATYNVLRADVL